MLKGGNFLDAKKIFETVLRVVAPKNKVIVLYFYSDFLIRAFNRDKSIKKELVDSLVLENLKVFLIKFFDFYWVLECVNTF